MTSLRPPAHAVRAILQPDIRTEGSGMLGVTVLRSLRALMREMRLLDRDVERRLGLPPAQAHALLQLATVPARSLNELAERTCTDPSSTSVAVHGLVSLGLVARSPAADDRRRTELTLTAAGRARVRRAQGTLEGATAGVVAGFGKRRAIALTHELEALLVQMQEQREASQGSRAQR